MTQPILHEYTPDDPCRCGYDGTGTHLCHAGRDPRWPGGRCQRPAVARLVAVPTCLAGVQLKVGVVVGHYCPECWVEAGFSPVEVKRE